MKSGEGRRFVSWLESGELEALDLNDTVGEQKAWVQLHSCQPAHLKSSGLAGQLTSLLSLQQLVKTFSSLAIPVPVTLRSIPVDCPPIPPETEKLLHLDVESSLGLLSFLSVHLPCAKLVAGDAVM